MNILLWNFVPRYTLQHDKFALTIRFIQNSQNCYNIIIDEHVFPTYTRFTQHLPNKLDKFWPAFDVHTKYIENGFPYLEKAETRLKSQTLSEFVVPKLIEPYTTNGKQ